MSASRNLRVETLKSFMEYSILYLIHAFSFKFATRWNRYRSLLFNRSRTRPRVFFSFEKFNIVSTNYRPKAPSQTEKVKKTNYSKKQLKIKRCQIIVLNKIKCVCVLMPTHCTITRFGFRAGRIDGVRCGLFFNSRTAWADHITCGMSICILYCRKLRLR